MQTELTTPPISASRRALVAVSLAVIGLLCAAPVARGSDFGLSRGDSAAVAEAVKAFGRGIATGDSAAVLALLAPDVVIVESGGVQSRSEYAEHHLQEDLAFRKVVPAVVGPLRVVVKGDVAWVTSTSVSQGQFEGRAINSGGAELMVLSRVPGVAGANPSWQIRAIHWSSRRLTK